MKLTTLTSLDQLAGANPLKFAVDDGDAAMGMLNDTIARAGNSIDAELFGVCERPTLDAIATRLGGGASMRLHADHERLGFGYYAQELLEHPDVAVTHAGAAPHKTHLKVLAGETESWVGTTGPHRLRPRRSRAFDMAATFGAQDTEVIRRMLAAARNGDPREIGASARAGLAHGFVLNDPAAGVLNLRKAVNLVASSAQSELVVASKKVDDRKFFAGLAKHAARGVDVLAETTYRSEAKDLARVRKAATDAVDFGVHPAGSPTNMHLNFVVADRELAYIGTGHLTKRGLGRDSAKRPSRELGIITRDPKAIAHLLDVVGSIPGSRIGERLG